MKSKFLFSLLFLLFGLHLFSFEPVLSRISPLGAKINSEVKVSVYGSRLKDFTGLLFSNDQIKVIKTIKVTDNKVDLILKIEEGCNPGLFGFRAVTKTGMSFVKLFSVNHLPVIQSKEPNSSFKTAQIITNDVTVEGAITSEDMDFYAIDAELGQRISVEVEGLRLGYTFFDPFISIYDKNKKVIKNIDDTFLLKQDPCFSFIAKEKGRYYVSIREAAFRGNNNCRYRLHLGNFPRPLLAYPLSVSSLKESSSRLMSDIPPTKATELLFKKQKEGAFEFFASDEKGKAPSPIFLHSHPLKSFVEIEPNPNVSKPNIIKDVLPITIDGIIQNKGDEDWFEFTAKKGEKYDVFVHARKFRSPLDPIVSLFDKNKKHIATNDDSGNPDSYLSLSAKYDGKYYLKISDSQKRGGLDYVYHVEFKKRIPEISTYMASTKPRTQEGQLVDVAVGNKAVLKMSLNQKYNSDELKVLVLGLPKGVSYQAANISPSVKTYSIVLSSKGDVPIQSGHLKVKLESTKNSAITGETKQSVNLVYGFPNNTVYQTCDTEDIPFVITEKAPFSVEILKPEHPLSQSGTLLLKVKVKREKNCKGDIRIQTVAEIPGVGVGKEIVIKKDQDTGSVVLSASSSASVGKWSFAVRGIWDAGSDAKKKKLGHKIVGSNLMYIDIVPMHVDATLEMSVVPQGEKVSMLCKLNHLKPFVGKATIELSGLPNAAVSKIVAFTSKDKEVWIEVQTDKKTRRGRHRSVFCYVKIPYQKVFVNQSIGTGTLRVDKPKPKEDAAVKKKKKLSRLNALRQEKEKK